VVVVLCTEIIYMEEIKKMQRAACNKVIFILYVCCIEFKSFLGEYLGKCGGVVVLFYGSSKVKDAN